MTNLILNYCKSESCLLLSAQNFVPYYTINISVHILIFFHFHVLLTIFQSYRDTQDAVLVTKSYNGDLAEADQSHHEESVDGIPELEVENATAVSVAEGVCSEGQSTQPEGAATSDSCIVNNTAEAAEVKCSLCSYIKFARV